MQTTQHARYRSLFWPIVLIGIGLIWLMGNFGILSLSLANLAVLFRLWPILLIVLGLDLLFGRRSPALGALLGFVAAGGILMLVLLGPSLGFGRIHEVALKTDHFSEAIDGATSAKVVLDVPVGALDVRALADSSKLIQADLTHAGRVDFRVSGEREKTIRLDGDINEIKFDNFIGWADKADDMHANISLSPSLPMELDINLDVGDAEVDLSRLQLTDLQLQGSVGQVHLTLPALTERYTAKINGDVGSFRIDIPRAADIDLDITGSVGDFTIDLPEGAGVQVQASVEIGDVDLPASFKHISGGHDEWVGKRGTWQSPNFERAEHQVRINFQGDVGGLAIR